ncbi:MAG: TonB-dependent receptor [Acidobacteriota bacterium]|nr:TonB-dependent receptor [Pyrinomonadaceae bacterium]MDW8303717.1 TonB-dependent receptor [Acidobacteriota bacterium]
MKKALVFAIAMVLTLTVSIIAQTGTGSVSGTVVDPQEANVAGATVTLASKEKGFSRTAVTDSSGSFSFPSIPPGDYELTVEAQGFKKAVRNVKVVVDTPLRVSISLEVGGREEVVIVGGNTAEALLNTQDATVGNTFVEQQVTQLPTEARNVINLLSLQPGVTRDGYVVGNRSDQSNITLDGVDINEAQTNDIFSPVLRLNSEAIEEFRVTTTTANANQGRSSGAQVSLVTKRGTNEYKGVLFLTGRRTQWSANNFFNNRAGVPREKFDKNVFGGAIGGPIIKDRLFFFYSYEGERTTRGQTAVRVVPLPNLGQGVVRFLGTNGQVNQLTCSDLATIFPAIVTPQTPNACNPAALSALAQAAAKYPHNNFDVGDSTAGQLLNTAGFRFNSDNEINNNSHVLRIDWNINSSQQLFFRGNYIFDVETFTPQFPDTPKPRLWSHPTGFVVGHTWTISNNLVNNFRFGLTRDAFSNQGDSSENAISFRFIYSPRLFSRTISRVTPVYNITDDFSWIWGRHTFQFGTNIRLISNKRETYATAYDSAITNPSFYPAGGQSVSNPINAYLSSTRGYTIASSSVSPVQNAVTAIIGRYTQYAANFTFNRQGQLLPSGTPSKRDFRTEEYDFYIQDVWKVFSNLTITAGLRYGLSRPVYEAEGYETKPTIPLGVYFRRRAEAAARGQIYDEPIVIDLSGPKNGRTPLYNWDRNNFQPRIAVAWSPNFGDNWFGRLIGRNGQSVIRGGFGIFNDYFGQALAVRFDLNNTLGFSSSSQIRANFYNLTTNPGPLFTGFNQSVRTLPNITIPSSISFPRRQPNRTYPTAIEGGLDSDLQAPIHYTWNLTYERTLPWGFVVTTSYLGRAARKLLQARDAAAPTNFVDPRSGMDWYTAATMLEILRQRGVPVNQVPAIPYFENLFPGLGAILGCPGANSTQVVYSLVYTGPGGCGTDYGNDWTSVQLELSFFSPLFPNRHIFYQPQYGTYGAWSTIGRSDYHAGTLTIRQRLANRVTFDFNYTFSKSMDEGSGLQSDLVTSGAGFILNPFRQRDMYALSDFDMKHIINANAIVQLPFGKGQPFFGNASKWLDLLIGGWQVAAIYRYNSGTPFPAPYDDTRWATNWNVQSYTTRTKNIKPCPTRGGKLFGCNTVEAYRSFRNAYPGETGERNVFRLPGFWVLDMGFGKTFDMPWNEEHKLQFRWEIFNLTNTQKMGAIDTSRSGYGIALDPAGTAISPPVNPPTNWSNFIGIQGEPRSMQFVLRYTFK